MSALGDVVHLGDLDLLLAELADPLARSRLKKMGFATDGAARLAPTRARNAAQVDRRWLTVYERVRNRYGRAVASVRHRVCLGCFVTLPTTARPRPAEEEPLTTCESCGRILYWG